MHPLQTRYIAEIEMLAESSKCLLWAINKEFNQELFISSTFTSLWGRSVVKMYENNKYTDSFMADSEGNSVFEKLKARVVHPEYTILYRIQLPNGKNQCILDRTFHMNDEKGNCLFIAGVAVMIEEDDFTESTQDIISDRLDRICLDYYRLLMLPVSSSVKKKSSLHLAKLNDKQKLIFKALLQGLTAKEIAKQTGLSFRTIEAHTDKIKNLFNAKTKSDLIHLAIENNWVSVNI